jgi:hypothetical protein
MNVGRLIRDAWATTWRFRFLWVLALFAGSATGVSLGGGRSFGGQTNRGEVQRTAPEVTRYAEQGAQWAAAHVGLLVAAGVFAAAIGLALVVVWLIAQGGMAAATVELGTGHQATPGRAWRAGIHLFWRYAGLWLALALLSVAVAAVIGGSIALVVGFGAVTGSRLAVAVVALVLGVPLILALLALVVGTNIVVAYAQRAIAAEDEGPIAALRSGGRLLRTHLGESVLAWVVSLGLTVVAGIGIAMVVLLTAGILAGVGAGLWALAGTNAATIGYAILGGLTVLGVVALLAAITNTFFWNYWTLAYLRMSGRTQAPAGA